MTTVYCARCGNTRIDPAYLEKLEADAETGRHLLYEWFREDVLDEADYRKRLDVFLAALDAEKEGDRGGGVSDDPRFPHHVEGCICPRFKDIAPSLIADLTCPVHGIEGTDPGDKIEGYPEQGDLGPTTEYDGMEC